MQIQIGSRKRIQFTDKTHPVQGIISVILGFCSLVLLFALCILSGRAKGMSGIEAGILGVVDLVVSLVGFIMAIRCYRKEDIYLITPSLGATINGLLVILCMVLYIVGAA